MITLRDLKILHGLILPYCVLFLSVRLDDYTETFPDFFCSTIIKAFTKCKCMKRQT